jgi:crotonobetainyl-CoA:carnitine CoA-transferase CaiB-like acyl-CoA transferase
MLAGGITAALLQRAMTGKASVVDGSLLATGMWSMQAHITAAMLRGVAELPRTKRSDTFNPLSNNYRTSDGRFLILCMLQSQRYWPALCAALDRPDLIDDARFATDEARVRNAAACVQVLDETFAARTLEAWKPVLAGQGGAWGVVGRAGELHADPQVSANSYIQEVDYGDGRAIRMVTAPLQFDGEPLPARPAPALGAHSDEVLAAIGYSEDEIIDLKVAGIVF